VIATEEEELTGEHQVVSIGSPIFSWAWAKEPDGHTSANGALLKLIAVAVVGLVLVSVGLFVLMRSTTTTASTDAQAVAQNAQPDPSTAPGREGERNVAVDPAPLRSTAGRAEDELKKLRDRRIAAGAKDRSAILEAFASTEKRYPNDYRFPYERAKLAIKGQQARSHDEAFAALSLAAEKAINAGKAHEMLDGLEADKAGDLRKLSHGHGHHEWTQVEAALKSKDKSLLRL